MAGIEKGIMRLVGYIVLLLLGVVIGSYFPLTAYLPPKDTVLETVRDNVPFLADWLPEADEAEAPEALEESTEALEESRETASETVEETIESAEEAIEDVVEDAATETAEETVEEFVVDAVTETAEEAVEDVVEDAATETLEGLGKP